MSKSKSKDYSDDPFDYEYSPYGRKSEYLEKKRNKRMQKALRTRDVNSLLEQNDDYDDEDDRRK